MKKRNYLLLAGLLVIVGINCESSTNNEPVELEFGKFEGVVGTSQNTGLYEELEGQAWYSLNETDSVFSFELYSDLISDTSKTEIFLRIKSLDVPSVGTYTFNNIDTISKVELSGFSGFYYSPTVGLKEQYYTESGTLTISSVIENAVKGEFEGVIFSKAYTDSSNYTRRYSKMKAAFNAISIDLKN